MVKQNALTVIVPVNPRDINQLKETLGGINNRFEDERHTFVLLKSIHFARWIILDEATVNGQLLRPRLAFSSNFDGDKEQHLTSLCTDLSNYFDAIYTYCDGYPAANNRTPKSRKAYLVQSEVKYDAFYVGAPGRTVIQIKQECDLRNYIRQFLNSFKPLNKSASQIHGEIKEAVLQNKEFEWVKTTSQLPGTNWFPLILLGLALLVLTVSLVLPVWVLLLHFLHERKDVPLGITRSYLNDKIIQDLEEYEDIEFQNQFTQVLIMKTGFMRRVTLKAFMLFTQTLAKNFFVKGKLMNIPTIHFARWVMIDKGKRMLFLSNFDGSWQQYLGDFIDKTGWGLTAIWSNTVGFPKTNFLVTGGAYDEELFLAWSRYYEIKTQVWYSAYPHLSVKNIISNSLIRSELMNDLDEEKAQIFLNRF